MEYGILGPLTVSRDGRELRLGGARQRSLLAVLLLRANELVPTARIVDELWGERPPPTAVKAVQVQVSKLRKLLDEGAIETRPTGYLLRVEPGTLDLERFESLLDRGRERLAQGDAREAAKLLREALGLWRGSPLAEFAYETFARNEIGRLEGLRLDALELRLEAGLALGRHSEVVGELEGLVRDHPLRESFAGLLILALYRAGRQADALAVMQVTRTRLRDELGLDPSQALQQLEKQILLQDPALDLPATKSPGPAPAAYPSAPTVMPAPPRPEAPVTREQRKTVTVLFCDVVGSTSLGESTDPEALRALLARYFERMKAIIEQHGGTVEKFIGDAVMAVFGVPVVHEDDPVRALRAAMEMREALPELGVEGRIGVDTGEVVTGTAERLATGDAVHVAARLQQAAAPGEVVLGRATWVLARDAVAVEELGLLELKGKQAPVAAYRLVGVREAPERLHEARFVGRTAELALLLDAWGRVVAGNRCDLLTIVGEAGIGKSRLVAELVPELGARVVRGRCLPYGEGITYWPVIEVAKQLDALPSDDVAAAALRSLLGESERATSADEIAWAFRKLLEEQAPLVVCFDDLQWGEETFLDLVESTGLLSAGTPLLLLCMARQELLERRPSWPAPMRLEPLPPDEADALIGRSLPEDVRRRIADRAGGNPLFITEMLALATDGGELEVPPTLRALLAARLDQLEPQERSVLERGAVEGEVFHRGAVQALAPEEPELLPRLAALVRHGLIRPERPQLPGEDAFRFRHLLIRDAAYDALPKAVRADLHRRFAGWLEDKTALVELDELLGYHLERAAGYHAELGRPDPGLALRAGDRLLAAGVRALGREDERAAAGLLERGLSLTRPLRLDVHAELDLAQAFLHEPERAARIAEQTALRAGDTGDETGEALARAIAASFRLKLAPSAPDELETLLLDARRRLEEAEDHVGLMYVWSALGHDVAAMRGGWDDWATASEQALHHSRLAGRSVPPATNLGVPLVIGPRPADEALAAVDRLLAETGSSWLLFARAWLLAMLDRGEKARQEAEEADARLRDQSTSRWGDWFLAELSLLAGDHEAASRHLRIVCDWLEAIDDFGRLSTYLPLLGRSLCVLGRFDEAERLAERARAIDEGNNDAMTQAYSYEVLARVHAHRGELAEAERLAREAVAETERTDSLNLQAEALCDLGEVLAAAGRPDEAATALEQALERCKRKKNLALARQVGERLVELRAETQPA